jgi:hypothetical protein
MHVVPLGVLLEFKKTWVEPCRDILQGVLICRMTNTQFSMEELSAIVQEAEAAGTYVAAHAYTPPAIKRALAAGVRSIEHGNWLDEDTAQLMAGALCCVERRSNHQS